jgi:hypothetical protein
MHLERPVDGDGLLYIYALAFGELGFLPTGVYIFDFDETVCSKRRNTCPHQ